MNPFQPSLRDGTNHTEAFPALKGRAKINRRSAMKIHFLSPAEAGSSFLINCLPSTKVLGYYQTSASRTKLKPSLTVGLMPRSVYFAALRLERIMDDNRFLGRWPRLLHCAPSALLSPERFK